MKNVFSENLDALIKKFDINVKSLVHSDDPVTYGYVLRVRRGTHSPTTHKAHAIVQIMQRHPQARSYELWMYFADDYIKTHAIPDGASSKLKAISDLLSDAAELGILPSTQKQRESVQQLAMVLEKRSA